MRRSELLKFIKAQLEKLGAQFPVYELYIHPGNLSEVSVGRTMLVEGASSEKAIVDIFSKYHSTLIEGNCISRYDNPDSILASELIAPNARDLSLNWRGRFYKWEDLNISGSKVDFDEKVLASYWRLIITRKDDDYFTRYEISPTYYNPGHSTAGQKDFRGGINSFLKFLLSLRERWQVDPRFDRIVVFARVEPTKNFTRCTPDFFNGENYINFEGLKAELNNIGEAGVVDQIYDSIRVVTT